MAYHSAYNRDDGGRPRDAADRARTRSLLPPAIANFLLDSAMMATGAACLLIVAVAGLSLASWSPADPSLTHATSAPPQNLLGRPGSTLADLLIDVLGLASLALIVTPLFLGLALLRREAIGRPIRRVAAAVAGTACTAMALAAFAPPAIWPAHHGLGGFAGEALVRLSQAAMVGVPPALSSALIMVAAGGLAAALLGLSTGLLWNGDERGAVTTTLSPGSRRFTRKSTRTTGRCAAAPRVEPAFEGSGLASRAAPVEAAAVKPAPSVRDVAQYGPYAFFEQSRHGEHDDSEIHSEFDAQTHAASSAIAARFAPSDNSPKAMQEQVSSAFQADFVPQYPPAQNASAMTEAVDPGSADTATWTQTAARSRDAKPSSYKRPSLNLLERPRLGRAETGVTASVLRGTARLLEDVLAEFGVLGSVRAITPGPVIAAFEFEPERGTKLDRIVALADDIARGMRVVSARIGLVPGRPVVMIELPNGASAPISLRDVLDTEAYRSSLDILPLAIGKTASGLPIVSDLARMPSLLVAGEAGSGKSAGVQAMILSLIYKHGPDNCRFLLIDKALIELARFEGIPHLLTPVVSDPHKAVTALAWCVREMEERLKRMAALGARSIDVYNNRVRNAEKRGERIARTVQTGFDERTGAARFEKTEMKFEAMPYIVIVIEELADLMAVAGREVEGAVQRLAVAARQTGIHLIVASERPSSDVVTPALKAGIAARMSFRVKSRADSRTVLGSEGAEQLLGGGDMLLTLGTGEPARIHGVTVSEIELDQVTDHLRAQGKPKYVAALMAIEPRPVQAHPATAYAEPRTQVHQTRQVTAESRDALYDRAVAIVVREGRASVGLFERRLNLQRQWAIALLRRLEDDAIIGPADGNGQHPLRSSAAA